MHLAHVGKSLRARREKRSLGAVAPARNAALVRNAARARNVALARNAALEPRGKIVLVVASGASESPLARLQFMRGRATMRRSSG